MSCTKRSNRYCIKRIIIKKASGINISIEVFDIMPDHIHLFIKNLPNISISYIVKHLKGYTSFMLRKQFIDFNKYKSLWTYSYFCETIGLISEKTIIYIYAKIKNNHLIIFYRK